MKEWREETISSESSESVSMSMIKGTINLVYYIDDIGNSVNGESS